MSELDDWFDEQMGRGPAKPTARPKGLWDTFREGLSDAFLEGALHNPIGAEGVVRATTNLSTEELNKRERILSDRLAAKRAKTDEQFKNVDTLSPANIGRKAVDLLGNVLGGADPTYVLAPGKSIAQRAGAQGLINEGINYASQFLEKQRGVRDEISHDEAALSGVGGAVLQGGGDMLARNRAAKAIARGGVLNLNTAKDIGNKFGTVTSTVRTPKHNKEVGGVPNSYHVRGQAIDIARGKGVNHKQLERAYRRAGYDIIESLDEGDHSHFAFRFGGKAPETAVIDFPKRGLSFDKAHYEADIKRQMDEDPSLTRENFEPYEEYAAWASRENGDDASAPFAPPIDSYHEKFTPYVERPNDPANDQNITPFTGDFRNQKLLDNVVQGPDGFYMYKNPDGSLRDLTPEEQASHFDAMSTKFGYEKATKDAFDELTPAERQEMDASAVRPDVPPTTPKGLGKGSVATTPVNDFNIRFVGDLPTQRLAPAILHKDGRVYVGDENTAHINVLQRYPGLENYASDTGGFVTPDGRYLTREEASKFVGSNQKGLEATSYAREFEDLQNHKKYEQNLKEATERLKIAKTSGDPEKIHAAKRALKLLKDIIDDDEGAFRPFGRDKGSKESPDSPPILTPEGKTIRDKIAGKLKKPKTPVDYAAMEPEARFVALAKKFEPLNAAQRALRKEEQGKRFSNVSRLQAEGGGRENFYKQKAAMRGLLPRAEFKSIAEHFSEEDFTQLANRINFSNSLLPGEKMHALEALHDLLGADGARLPTSGEIKILSEIYSPDFIKALLDNRPLWEKVWHHLGSAVNLPRALMSSVDFSAPFRQGVGFVGRKEFWKALGPMFKVFGSEKNSKALMQSFKDHPNWLKAKEAGLAIVDPHSHYLADREEPFQSDWGEKIPGLGWLVKASNRSYSGFLNKLRFDVFNDLLSKYEKAGLNPDEAQIRKIAKFVNTFSGRGDMGQIGNAAAPALAAGLFSPRLIASRIKMLASPVTYLKTDPILRKEAWKSILSYSAYVLAALTFAKEMTGADVETDWRSADFGKAKWGNTRKDVTGGLAGYVRLLGELGTASKITNKGEEAELGGGFNDAPEGPYDESLADVIGRFLRSKESPFFSFLHDFAAGENVVGEPFYRDSKIVKDLTGQSVNAEVAERFIPMTSNDLYDVFQDRGFVGGLGLTPGALLGDSTSVYEPRPPKTKEQDELDPMDKIFKDLEAGSSSDLDKWFEEQTQ